MTNEALKAFISEYSNRIFVIVLDNNHKVFIGSPLTTPKNQELSTIDKIQYKTVGGVDLFGFKRVDETYGEEVPFINWMVTGCIQSIAVTEEEGTYLPDLNKWF